MDKYWTRLFRAWPRLVALAVVGGVVFAVHAGTATRSYSAHASLFITSNAEANAVSPFQGSEYVQDRMRSYVELVKSSSVLEPVANQLGGAVTTTELESGIYASNPSGTVVINIDAETVTSAELAAQIANTMATVLASEIKRIEGGHPIQPEQVTTADPSQVVPVKPSVPVSAALGIILGVLVAMAVALIPRRSELAGTSSPNQQDPPSDPSL